MCRGVIFFFVKPCAVCMKCRQNAPSPFPYISGVFPAAPERLCAALPVPAADAWQLAPCTLSPESSRSSNILQSWPDGSYRNYIRINI